jgi:DNA polymerase III subunit delta'
VAAETTTEDAFAGVAGQEAAVAQLRAAAARPVHAYLLVGPPGAGARAGAIALSAALLCPDGGCGHCRDCRLALAGEHPDALTFAPSRAFLRREDAEEIVRLAVRSPVEGRRKVLVLTELHRVQVVAPMLLKTIEEPPASTVFVILADHVPPELVTIASRCARVDVPPLADDVVARALAAEGVDEELAALAAPAAGGDLDRGRLLVGDAGLAARREAWARVPDRLDGTGAAVAVVVAELLAAVEEAAEPLRRAQTGEVARLDERIAATGERGSGRKQLEDEHRPQLRRHRAAELRAGLRAVAARYRDALAAGTAPPAAVGAVDAVHEAAAALARNVNEPLLLHALLLRLPPLGGGTAAAGGPGSVGGPPE